MGTGRVRPNRVSNPSFFSLSCIFSSAPSAINPSEAVVHVMTWLSLVRSLKRHFNLADVVDKPDHARKRKVLSSAYALKNLESWEFKVTDKVQRMFKHFDKVCTEPPMHYYIIHLLCRSRQVDQKAAVE